MRTIRLVHYIAPPQSYQHRQVGNTFNITDGNPNLNNASSPSLQQNTLCEPFQQPIVYDATQSNGFEHAGQ